MAIHLHHRHQHYSSSSSDDSAFLLQRKTPLQLRTLEILFADDKHPTQNRIENYASGLGLTSEQVKRWFIERRRKDKQEAAKSLGGNGSAGSVAKSRSKTKNKKSVSYLAAKEDGIGRKEPILRQDLLYSPNNVPPKVFRRNGLPLGMEFDPLPTTAFQGHCCIPDGAQIACQNEQRALKRRKVSNNAMSDAEKHSQVNTPVKKHGMGKGFMSVLQLLKSQTSTRDKMPAKKHGMGKGLMSVLQLANHDSENIRYKRPPKRKIVMQRRSLGKAKQEKKMLSVRQKKVLYSQKENQNAGRGSCKLALFLASCGENESSLAAWEDDEELEMRELQAGPNPLTCSAHFSTGGTHGCSLCKGLLPKFPPDSVSMKKPLSRHPWNSSLELVKKLFKVFQFLYTYAVIINVCPFAFEDFVQAFHEKDSLLLGKLHMCLLDFLLSDIEKELTHDLSVHSSKNCMFLNLLYMAKNQNFILNFWRISLNSLTWTEILRQVLVAAGFGSKDGISKKGCSDKDADTMLKYGLTPGTLKGELFNMLMEQGSKGMKVSELANSSQIVDLGLSKTAGELEDAIGSMLAGDITLFEKISSCAYRLRLKSIMKKDEEALSDNDCCGCIDEDFRDCATLAICNSEFDSRNATSRFNSRHHSGQSSTPSIGTEIDESHPGESWLLGLMDGEYSDLSIEERLNVLLALVDLLGAGYSIRREDSSAALAECVPSVYQHGSGGKIKRSALRQPTLPTSSWSHVRETCSVENLYPSEDSHPVDSSVLFSAGYKHSTGKEKGHVQHPMQSMFLGSDRRYNRYWLFLGPCNTDDSGHMRVYFESSEDGHWEVIDSGEALCELLAALNIHGRREAVLLVSLEKCTSILLDEMSSRTQVDEGVSQSVHSDLSELDRVYEGSPSSISDTDNNLSLTERSHDTVISTGAAVLNGEKVEVQRQKYTRLQAYDSWVWNSFYSGLNAVKHGKRSYFESLTRCTTCHDLYWRDERHCKSCHKTFEIDFDLEEKYAIHVATCQAPEDADIQPIHNPLPSRLQALKAAIHAIELVMPEDALIGPWKKSSHKLWVRRLRRTSSLQELSQVLADFVGAINLDWLSKCNVAIDCDSTLEDIVACFQNMPQTTSAVALWLVKLDSLIASHSK